LNNKDFETCQFNEHNFVGVLYFLQNYQTGFLGYCNIPPVSIGFLGYFPLVFLSQGYGISFLLLLSSSIDLPLLSPTSPIHQIFFPHGKALT
jgi:hypothetical protein